MVKITGGKEFTGKIAALGGSGTVKRVGQALFKGGEAVQVAAQISITTGSASGTRTKKHLHQPSAPGTPPNNLSGHLAGNIETVQVAPLKVEVSSNAKYSAIQEYGGTINHPGGQPFFMKDGEPVWVSKKSPAAARLPKTKPHTIVLPERPFMRPALAAKKQEVVDLIARAIVPRPGRDR